MRAHYVVFFEYFVSAEGIAVQEPQVYARQSDGDGMEVERAR